MSQQLRIVISREDFRELVAGREVRKSGAGVDLLINLNLDREEGMSKYSDPPAAREFLPTHHQRRPRT